MGKIRDAYFEHADGTAEGQRNGVIAALRQMRRGDLVDLIERDLKWIETLPPVKQYSDRPPPIQRRLAYFNALWTQGENLVYEAIKAHK